MSGNMLPNEEILTDLVTRFILNVPYSEWETFERLMFLVEQAHWHYEDCIVEANPHLRSLGIKEFTTLLFDKVPGLESFKGQTQDILRDWQQYKAIVPVNGAILLDPTMNKCLLVRGYKSGASWGFPRGKVAKDESDMACAIREVLEETGFNISSRINAEDYVEVMVAGQRSRLYIIQNVPENTVFAPQVRKEIGAFAWHSIAELPADKEQGGQVYVTDSGERHRFFVVWPFVKTLRKWIKKQRQGQGQGQRQGQGKQVATPATPTPAAAVATVAAPQAAVGVHTGCVSRCVDAATERVATAVWHRVSDMPAAWREWKLDHAAVLSALG